MTTTQQSLSTGVRRATSPIPLLLILGLLTLRLPFLVGMRIFFTPSPAWVEPDFQIGTYLLTAMFIIAECHRLADYHIDSLALWIIILFKPLETLIEQQMSRDGTAYPLAFPGLPSLVIWAIALALPVALRLRHTAWPKIRWGSAGWLLAGVLAGIFTAGVVAVPISLGVLAPTCAGYHPRIAALIGEKFPETLRQIGYAAIIEEPLFRGFLWGALFKLGWKNVWIWLFQAALFTLSHLYYLFTLPNFFFLVIPIGAFALGLIAWRSRSIAACLVAHGLMNGFSLALGCILYGLRV